MAIGSGSSRKRDGSRPNQLPRSPKKRVSRVRRLKKTHLNEAIHELPRVAFGCSRPGGKNRNRKASKKMPSRVGKPRGQEAREVDEAS